MLSVKGPLSHRLDRPRPDNQVIFAKRTCFFYVCFEVFDTSYLALYIKSKKDKNWSVLIVTVNNVHYISLNQTSGEPDVWHNVLLLLVLRVSLSLYLSLSLIPRANYTNNPQCWELLQSASQSPHYCRLKRKTMEALCRIQCKWWDTSEEVLNQLTPDNHLDTYTLPIS